MTNKNHAYFLIIFVSSLAASVLTNLLPFLTASLIIVFSVTLSFYVYFTKRNIRLGSFISWLGAIVLGILVGLYRPNNFNYPMVFSVDRLYDGGLPVSLYINIGKFFVGIIIFYFILSYKSIAPAYIQSKFMQYLFALVLASLILVVAYSLLKLHFHVKPLKYIALFGFVNLLVTCFAEEAFMRLLLQSQIQKFISGAIKKKFLQEIIPLGVITFIFVVTHFVAGFNTILVFALAGLSYGLVYSLTKNVWACIAIHFAVNIIHFSFFTYPLA